MRKITLILFGFLISINLSIFSQNGLIGDGFGTQDWNTTDNFIESAGGSRIGTFSPTGTGNRYFRLVTNWGVNNDHYGPNSTTDDYQVTPSTAVPLSEIVHNSTSKAYYINVTDQSHKYVFKTKAGGNPPSPLGLIVFKIEGEVRSVSSVSQSPTTVNMGQDVTITVTLDNTLSTGQGVYLRYTKDNFVNSSIIEMTGSETSFSASIPGNVNSNGANINYYIFTSGASLTIAHGDADWYTININNNNGSNFGYVVGDAYVTKANGDWNDPNTWLGGVPPAGAKTIIAHNVTLNQDANVSSLTINTDATLTASDATPRTLTIADNGTLTNNGTFTHANGTVTFAGAGTVSGTFGFNNVNLYGGVNFGSASIINGILDLRAGSWVNTNAPTYAAGSTLKYNTGDEYGANAEWYANLASGQGIPDNVVIGDVVANSGLSFGTSNAYRYASGDLTISNSASLSLSSAGGGDLKLGGDFTNNGTYNSNSRAIFFEGTSLQNITSTTNPFNIGLIINSNSAGLQINTPLTLELNNTGKVVIPSGVTLVGNTYGTGNAVVNQTVTVGNTYAISSPVSGGSYTGKSYFYNANTANNVLSSYSEVINPTMVNGLGYAVQPSGTNIQMTGTLNNAPNYEQNNFPISIPIYYNGNQKDKYRGWNLIGNPFASVLNWKQVYAANSSVIQSSVWFGFNAQAAYNASGDVSVPVEANGQIAPMQGFWVLSSESATSSSPISKDIILNNDYRMHITTGSSLLRAPRVSQNQIIRLQATNGTSTDEMLLYFNPNASDAYDDYDTRKMVGTSTPQLYTMLNGMPMLINGMNAVPYDKEINLAFRAETAGTYKILSTEFSNFDQTEKILLKDKLTGKETDLSVSEFEFTAEAGTNLTRFSLVLPKSGIVSSTDKNFTSDMQLLVVDGILNILLPSYEEGARVNVYSNVGQLVATKTLQGSASRLNKPLSSGVYIVTVHMGTDSQTQKLIVK